MLIALRTGLRFRLAATLALLAALCFVAPPAVLTVTIRLPQATIIR
jgi:hypothetical protein